jgi:predicted enzyme related to lactoylglutathione lyase
MAKVNPTRLCQLLIEVSDLNRAKSFYQDVFGWKPVPAELLEMVVMDVPPDCPFGIALIPKALEQKPISNPLKAGTPWGLKAIFAIDDPESIVERCQGWKECQVTGPRTHPGYGLVWDITDPDGLTWGLFKRTASSQETINGSKSPST